jgi:hypothetical protein
MQHPRWPISYRVRALLAALLLLVLHLAAQDAPQTN